MAPNATLLREVLAQIETHPETWRQSDWRCGTGMCFAGWTAELAGGKWIADANSWRAGYLAVEPGDTFEQLRYFQAIGYAVGVEDRATRLLSLTKGQADDLFCPTNSTLAALRRRVAELVAEVRHVTIRLVPVDELQIGEEMPDGRPPMEIVEHRPDQSPMAHGTERGIAPHELRERARAVADRLGVDYIDPISHDVMRLLASAERA